MTATWPNQGRSHDPHSLPLYFFFIQSLHLFHISFDSKLSFTIVLVSPVDLSRRSDADFTTLSTSPPGVSLYRKMVRLYADNVKNAQVDALLI